MDNTPEAASNDVLTCQQCEKRLGENEAKEITEKGAFCMACFTRLAEQVQNIIQQQSQDINYPMAIIGAAMGAAIGALVWWGFTVLTKIEFGLVAVVIGFTVGKGILLATGGKRSKGLQILSVLVSGVAYFYANYLVSRTFILNEHPDYASALSLVPDPMVFIEISRLSFGLFTVVFLAFVIYEAWRLVAPIRLEEAV
jgi:hypothetical protein